MGINADGNSEDDPGAIRAALVAAWFKGKVILTGVALKSLTEKYFSYDVATFLKPFSAGKIARGLRSTRFFLFFVFFEKSIN